MKKAFKYLNDRYVHFDLLGFLFDSDDLPEYSFYFLTISIADWTGSCLFFRYDPDSNAATGDTFEMDILWLKQGFFWLVDKIRTFFNKYR